MGDEDAIRPIGILLHFPIVKKEGFMKSKLAISLTSKAGVLLEMSLMTKTGVLKKKDNGLSFLDGTLLAREPQGGETPFAAATNYLVYRGCGDGDCITVTGIDTTIGSQPVIFIDTATKVDASLCIQNLHAEPQKTKPVRAAGPGRGGLRVKPKSKAPKENR